MTNCDHAKCLPSHEIQAVQPFPKGGSLSNNLNQGLDKLKPRVRQLNGRAYSYIVGTVKRKTDQETTTFEQHGSGPNFQGDVLTLCTCKHQMRSRLSAEEWQGDIWIAGFTSRTIHDAKHWLFYLAKLKSAHDSHTDLWTSMKADSRKEKAAHLHYLGDMFRPTTPKPTGDAVFSPSRYLRPENHTHRRKPSDNGWKRDINYRHAVTSSHAPLLVADPDLTFLWEKPLIYFTRKRHCRDYHTWPSIHELMGLLREIGR